jgi:hypothetical protein
MSYLTTAKRIQFQRNRFKIPGCYHLFTKFKTNHYCCGRKNRGIRVSVHETELEVGQDASIRPTDVRLSHARSLAIRIARKRFKCEDLHFDMFATT